MAWQTNIFMKLHTLPQGTVVNLESITSIYLSNTNLDIRLGEQIVVQKFDSAEEAQACRIAILAACAPPENSIPLPEAAIAVLDKGFVYAGFVHFSECGQYLTIRQACCVRRWSVERGLGKVASEGPDKHTVLNDGPDIFVPSHALIHLLAINRAAWARFKE